MSLTKSEISSKVHEKVGISHNDSLKYVNSFFEMVKSEAERTGLLKFSGFGNFAVKEKTKRKGRNPQNGEVMYISERKVLKFKPSNVLKNKVNRQNGLEG
jgi:integration host factor subunit alpha